MLSFPLRYASLALLGAFCVVAAAAAQDADVPVVTKTTAIRNARIVTTPGRVIERGTVVMRNGLITAVGPNAEIPYDAEIISGDSLTVYAGFVDGLSQAGIPKPEDESRTEKTNTAEPPPDLAGIQPERRARDLFDPSDTAIDQLRRAGFAAAHVVPRGRMLPGIGSIVLLTGGRPGATVLKPDVSLFMQFQGGAGVYPNTAMGVMATLRQLVRESSRHRRIEIMYAENPAGLERPIYDPVHEAFYPVLSRERPVFVLADGDDSSVKVHRALQLQEELRFSLALSGLHQGFDVADDLVGRGIPLFLTLDLPKEKRAADTTGQRNSTYNKDLRTRTAGDVAREKQNLEMRLAVERERYVSTASRLHAAGLRFGFSTLGAKPPDIRSNVRRMVAAGLPEEAALAALTIDAARLLGVERSLGTVEEGKIANLVVVRGSYFDGESPIRFVFVDGQKFGFEKDPAPSSLAGKWEVTAAMEEWPLTASLTLRADGGSVGGEIAFPDGSSPAALQEVRLLGRHLEFAFDTDQYGRIAAEVTVTPNSFSGTLDVAREGTVDVSGTRVPEKR